MKSLVVVVSRRLMAVSTSGATSHTYTLISCTTRLFPFFPLAWARWPSRTCRASTYTHTHNTHSRTYLHPSLPPPLQTSSLYLAWHSPKSPFCCERSLLFFCWNCCRIPLPETSARECAYECGLEGSEEGEGNEGLPFFALS